MNISEREMMDHPLMRQVQADIVEARRLADMKRMEDAQEAARIRAEQGVFLRKQFHDAVDEYEEQRRVLHQILGRVWIASQEYSRVTGSPPPDFPENTFNEINTPTLRPAANHWSSGFSTARAAVMGWFASTGKRWE
ncbi:MAG: hypothetical protein JNL87_23025 [Burkholderiaceae bacterium]|nr:hypothetical protein [Burkholderiaceae bacterium]